MQFVIESKVKILIRDGLANIPKNVNIETLTPEKIENHIIKLLNLGKITHSDYVKYYIESGAIMLLEYLKYRGVINEMGFKIAIAIEENEGYSKKKKIGEILIEKN